MRVPHPIPYQGSKRALAQTIISYFPSAIDRLIEPFCGSAAVSLAALSHERAQAVVLNDLNGPLVKLWQAILEKPDELANAYAKLWHEQAGDERRFYAAVRDKFNETQRPDYFLYLLARCVKASVRYNSAGEFNQGPDNRRKGARPDTMREHILGAAELLSGRATLHSLDYRAVLEKATPHDLVYMDPPYQGVCRNRDPRYFSAVSSDDFVAALAELNQRGIAFIVSYDGRTGAKQFGPRLPDFLALTHLELHAGRSTQATLLGREDDTFESLYLSPALVERNAKQTGPRRKHHMEPLLFEVAQ